MQINVAVMEYHDDGKAIWIHDNRGCTVLRIQCSGRIVVDKNCTNICAHADINVNGDINLCVPRAKRRLSQGEKAYMANLKP